MRNSWPSGDCPVAPTPGGRSSAVTTRSAGEWFAESYRLCAIYGPQMPYEAWTDGFAGLRLPGRPRLGRAGCVLPAHPAGRLRGGPARSGEPYRVRASRGGSREPQGGRMPRHRPAAARRVGAVREGGRRLSCRAVARHPPDPPHGQRGAPPRSFDSRQRPAGVRARPSVAARARPIATSCPSPAVGAHRPATLIRPYRSERRARHDCSCSRGRSTRTTPMATPGSSRSPVSRECSTTLAITRSSSTPYSPIAHPRTEVVPGLVEVWGDGGPSGSSAPGGSVTGDPARSKEEPP